MQTVNWGILGAAKFARQHMGPAIHAAAGARLYGVASRSGDISGFTAFAPDCVGFDSYDALLASPEIDAVYIPLPNHLHVEWAEKALRAGKHVLCEKPIAMKAGEIDALIALRDETRLLCAEAYMIVHHPQWQRAREIVQSGGIGDLVLVDSVFSYDNSAETDNIRNKPDTGGGGIPDIGVYTFGSVRFVTGEEPSEVDAQITWENGVDVFAHVTADFPSFRYSSVTSMRMHPRQEVTFQGRDGVLKLTAPFNPNVFGEARLHWHRNTHGGGAPSVTVERWPGVNHYVLQVEAFCRTVREGADYPTTLEFAKGTQAMIDRVFEAAG
ncbi:Gfo/Idh/MocA family oxidoreductase [uncultured Litoreibacter sp.]|uniref:Gfo/Idh/MocA family protein n=1 Tax=uncultured Litoreibacter sp. TaxID=1392394 RepID=UPI0026185D5C|nr:Gfo/Idh/MocA family oxidoreductase [uncultured Litoreibacter sp.]